MFIPRHSTRILLLATCLAALLTPACGKKRTAAGTPRKTPSRASAARPSVAAVAPGTTQTGLASWYGEPYHGRRAANGEIYDMNKMTAAHRTLPFDTLVEVLNLDNRQQVRVRINDRGPFIDGRIIDLSRAAAQEISMLGPGTAKVRIEVLGSAPRRAAPVKTPAPVPAPPAVPPEAMEQDMPCPDPTVATPQITSTGYAVQIGAFREAQAAEKLQRRMASRYGSAYIENVRSEQGMLYRVRVGPQTTLAEATRVADSLAKENIQSLVVRVGLPVRN